MMIELQKLRQNPIAVQKYQNREVKIFCPNRMFWMCKTNVCCFRKENASIFLVKEAIGIFLEHQRVELHFVDNLGESVMGIQEFDSEDIYSCTSVTFDRLPTYINI